MGLLGSQPLKPVDCTLYTVCLLLNVKVMTRPYLVVAFTHHSVKLKWSRQSAEQNCATESLVGRLKLPVWLR